MVHQYKCTYSLVARMLSLCAAVYLFALPNLNGQCELTCISQVNVSLDQSCQATITPATLLSNYSNISLSDLNLRLLDEEGIPLASNEVSIAYLNQNLTYELTSDDPSCNTACWGNVLIEYKFLPIIDCPADLTLSCGALDMLPLPEVINGAGNCIDAEFSVFLANEERQRFSCGDPGAEDYTFIITRTYQATDGNGNTATCQQTVTLARPDFDNVTFPSGSTSISCSDSDNFIFYDNNGTNIPLPWVTLPGSGAGGTDIVSQGVPFVCEPGGLFNMIGFCTTTGSGTGSGSPLIPVGGATVFNVGEGPELIPTNNGVICNAAILYTDMVVPSDGCRTKVFRTWELKEWFCAEEFQLGPSIQEIELIDDEAPVIVCPADFTVTTDDDCGGSVTLPMATATDGCGNGANFRTQTDNQLLLSNGGQTTLAVGPNVVTYIATDNCSNSSSCTISVVVTDLTEPVAICERNTAVSLTDSGLAEVYASTFDDGSWDECGLGNMLVRRMVSNCDDDDLNLGSSVVFCCADIGQEQMVLLRVFDRGGNYSDCMIRVDVQDLTVPEITCPKDLTADCNSVFDINNLSLMFGEAVATDNCMEMFSLSDTSVDNTNQCGSGTILRTVSVVDAAGQVQVSCKQTITLEDQNPFQVTDIVWPTSLFMTDSGRCSISDLIPENLSAPYDFPTFPTQDQHCSLLGFDYNDVITGQGGCMRIERTWQVVDWCTQTNNQFVVYTNPDIQIIEITSTTTPVIDLAANPITFTSNDIDCRNADVTISATTSNVCSAGLIWTYIVRDLAGNIMFQGNGNTISQRFVAATYNISWSVTTACGNIGNATQELRVVNTKTPIPVCMSAMTVELVNGVGRLETNMINVGSFSTCQNPVNVSFTEGDVNDDLRIFGCADIGTFDQPLWVTDLFNGAADFCLTEITVAEDPNAPCPPTANRFAISGEVYTEQFQSVKDVEVNLAVAMPNELTDIEGLYAFPDMPMGGNYLVQPTKNTEHLNGVSTLDLILIQRHLLGLELLESPYQMIAADINNNGVINGLDLVELRKLILGVYTELPHNTSWRFIDAEYEFVDELNPWLEDFEEDYEITSLEADMEIDFIGVKVGDVNGTAVTTGSAKPIDFRSHRWPLVMKIDNNYNLRGQSNSIDVSVSNYEDVSGWQGTLEFDVTKVEVMGIVPKVGGLSLQNFDFSRIEQGIIPFSFADTEMTSYENNTALFSVEVLTIEDSYTSELISLSSAVTEAEAYRSYNVEVPVELRVNDTSKTNKIIGAMPNPFVESTRIVVEMGSSADVRWEFYDNRGQLLYAENARYTEGRQTYELTDENVSVEGVIFVKLITDDEVHDFKLLKF